MIINLELFAVYWCTWIWWHPMLLRVERTQVADSAGN